jgi:hypothetical protein
MIDFDETQQQLFKECFIKAFNALTKEQKMEVIKELCSGVKMTAEFIVDNQEEIWEASKCPHFHSCSCLTKCERFV